MPLGAQMSSTGFASLAHEVLPQLGMDSPAIITTPFGSDISASASGLEAGRQLRPFG
jgi:hypothetical protein